jgi:type I restriction enzyme R subunit
VPEGDNRQRADLFRKDLARLSVAYDFLSRIVDFADTDLEKRSIYYKHLLRFSASTTQRWLPFGDAGQVCAQGQREHALQLSGEDGLAEHPPKSVPAGEGPCPGDVEEIIQQANLPF